MTANPTCPNCGRPMVLTSRPMRPEDLHAFECVGCGLVYLTDDHTPAAGPGKDAAPPARADPRRRSR
jgi:hypothetical protein